MRVAIVHEPACPSGVQEAYSMVHWSLPQCQSDPFMVWLKLRRSIWIHAHSISATLNPSEQVLLYLRPKPLNLPVH